MCASDHPHGASSRRSWIHSGVVESGREDQARTAASHRAARTRPTEPAPPKVLIAFRFSVYAFSRPPAKNATTSPVCFQAGDWAPRLPRTMLASSWLTPRSHKCGVPSDVATNAIVCSSGEMAASRDRRSDSQARVPGAPEMTVGLLVGRGRGASRRWRKAGRPRNAIATTSAIASPVLSHLSTLRVRHLRVQGGCEHKAGLKTRLYAQNFRAHVDGQRSTTTFFSV